MNVSLLLMPYCDSDRVHLFVSILTFVFVLLTALLSDFGSLFEHCPDCDNSCPVVDCYCYFNSTSSYYV